MDDNDTNYDIDSDNDDDNDDDNDNDNGNDNVIMIMIMVMVMIMIMIMIMIMMMTFCKGFVMDRSSDVDLIRYLSGSKTPAPSSMVCLSLLLLIVSESSRLSLRAVSGANSLFSTATFGNS